MMMGDLNRCALRTGVEMVVTDNTTADACSEGGCDGGPEQTTRASEACAERWAADSDSAFPAPVATLEDAMSLFDVVVAAIVSIGPRLSGEQIDRYATDIAYVANNDLDLALALVVAQDAESAWRESVETCKVTGDGGRAISSFQLHRHWWGEFTRTEICASNVVAAARAARALTVLARRGGFENALRLYVGCRASDPRATKRRATLRRLRALPAVHAYRLDARAAA